MNKLSVINVISGYKQPVLKEISFSIKKGEFVGFIGPNGAGKSTLIKTISGIIPYSGSILLDGDEISCLKPKDRAKKMAIVSQNFHVGFNYKVKDIVKMGRFCHFAKTLKSIQPFMEYTGVWRMRDHHFHELSGGEKQRVMISLALAQEPDLLLLDEPTSDLDIFRQIEIFDLMEKLRIEKGITIAAILHDLNLASLYCDRIFAIKDGKLVSEGISKEVLAPENLRNIYGADVAVIKRKDCDRVAVLYKKGVL